MTIRLRVLGEQPVLSVKDEPITLRNETTVIYQTDAEKVYTGAYHVIPKTYDEITLPTKSKVLADNVTIAKIPQFEVSNDSGGTTLILGEEYYGQ